MKIALITSTFFIYVRLKLPDSRVLNAELRKLSGDAKRELARKLLAEAENEVSITKNHQPLYQDTEFDNPFSTNPPAMLTSLDIPDGVTHAREPCLKPNEFVALKLQSVKPLGEMVAEYTFSLPHATDYTGCFPGQYVRVRLGKNERFLSPVTSAKELGRISLLLKHETHGMFSYFMRSLEVGKNNMFFTLLVRATKRQIFTVSELIYLRKIVRNMQTLECHCNADGNLDRF